MVTTGIKLYVGSALVSAMYDRSCELCLYQTNISAHPFVTLITGMGQPGQAAENIPIYIEDMRTQSENKKCGRRASSWENKSAFRGAVGGGHPWEQ